MPELPEVENTRRNLVRAGLPGSTIASTNITWANTVKSLPRWNWQTVSGDELSSRWNDRASF